MASSTDQEVDPALLADRQQGWARFTHWCTRSIVVIAIIVLFVALIV